ncbi:hypothetical protein P171DRAFT_170149 [Karstenula rhodostoma CBS 690.94]|uniref:Uncharacterized protein n=1 Tax=Karstenula rhodostoma CBS 690.94 TaxID=1392251 RepID=A0A9P4P4I5_9PLEO|nr:hypothetical protein P171DRAFT_170149 [Karstenula rhodostoma CBS 690.94]
MHMPGPPALSEGCNPCPASESRNIYIPRSAVTMTLSLQIQHTHTNSNTHPKRHRTLVYPPRVHTRTTSFQPPPTTPAPSRLLPGYDPY